MSVKFLTSTAPFMFFIMNFYCFDGQQPSLIVVPPFPMRTKFRVLLILFRSAWNANVSMTCHCMGEA